MLNAPSALRTAMRNGEYSRVSYVFLLQGGVAPPQTRATAVGRWAEVDYDHPPELAGVTFLARSDVRGFGPPGKQVLAGRDVGQITVADPSHTWRSFFERVGYVGHRMEVLWDYRYGAGLHYMIEYFMGRTVSLDWAEDDEGRRAVLGLSGPFSQMDPNLAVNLTAEQQKARRDAGDTSLDQLEKAWEIRLGRKPVQ